jgi:hypothetical protein
MLARCLGYGAVLVSLSALGCASDAQGQGLGDDSGPGAADDSGTGTGDSSSGVGADSGSGGSSDSGGGTGSDSSKGGATDGGAHDSGGDAGAATDGSTAGGLFASCSLDKGCIADCSPPANDPIATGNASFDLYDGCILAAMQVAGMTETWQGQLLKAQAYNESGITPVVTTSTGMCGGQNCGVWAISAGSISGDSPPGPCGSSSTDPFTGQVDYSHSYGLFQDTPACEGTFLQKTLPSGYTCTPTTTADVIPFGSSITFYCESATSAMGGYINAVQDKNDPLYATSIFNPAYELYVYFDYSWAINFQQANAGATGCTQMQQWYLSLAYWLTGNATSSCKLSGAGLQYVQTAISDYETVLYNKTWPYAAP